MNYTTALDIGERKRRQGGINEDSVAVTLLEEGHRDTERTSAVFVVADGAGGTQAGDIASYVATVEVSRRLTDRLWRERLLSEAAGAVGAEGRGRNGHALELTDGVVGDPLADASDETVQTVIERAIQAAHTRIVRVIGDLDLDSAYTTVVVAVVAGDRLHYGWVGDSRAYLVNLGDRDDDQRVTRLTSDHSEVERLLEQGAIDEVEAHVHRRSNRITRALGGTRTEDPAASSIEVDTASVPLYADDVLLLTSDGLIDAFTGAPRLHREYEEADDTDAVRERILERAVTDDEIGDVVAGAESLSAAADRFVDLSNDRGGKDNLSIVLARDESLPESPAGHLPIRTYDPEPEEVAEWETVKQFPADDAADDPADLESPGDSPPDPVEVDDASGPDDEASAGRERAEESTTHIDGRPGDPAADAPDEQSDDGSDAGGAGTGR
ncbi:MAG: protein phosphatase 2C domain-containing protein [Haloarculaceae archaeon]